MNRYFRPLSYRMLTYLHAPTLRGIFLLALLSIGVVGCASTKRQVIYYRGAPTNVREFSVNGLHVVLRPASPANHVIAAKLFIRGGIVTLPAGLSPAVEDLAMQLPPLSGPEGMKKEEYRRLIDRMVTGIVPGTERDYSTMTLRCVDENFDPSWDLFTGVIMHPEIDPIELRNVKERTMLALRNRLVNPSSYAEYLVDSAFYYNHPYGRYAQEADIPPIDEKMLLDYYRSLFVKSRLLLVVVGNVDSADLHAKIASSFGTLPQGNYADPVVPEPQNADSAIVIVRPPYGGQPAVTSWVVARYLAPNRDDSLYFPMLRLTSFLNGHLFREIRVTRNLSYAPDADVDFGKSSHGEISISTTLPDSAWRVAKHDVIDLFRTITISENSAKSGLVGWLTNNYMREQTNESQADEMGVAELYTGSWTNAFRTITAIRDMKPASMNQAAKRYLKNFTIAIVGDTSIVDPENYLPHSGSDDVGLVPGG